MTNPATPSQLAANNIAATHAVEGDPPREGRQIVALRAVLASTETALEHMDPDRTDTAGVEIMARWHDALTLLRDEVSAVLVASGTEPGVERGLVEGVRAMLSRNDLKAVVTHGTRLLDQLSDSHAAAADVDLRQTLDRHRKGVVQIVNDAQDAVDT